MWSFVDTHVDNNSRIKVIICILHKKNRNGTFSILRVFSFLWALRKQSVYPFSLSEDQFILIEITHYGYYFLESQATDSSLALQFMFTRRRMNIGIFEFRINFIYEYYDRWSIVIIHPYKRMLLPCRKVDGSIRTSQRWEKLVVQFVSILFLMKRVCDSWFVLHKMCDIVDDRYLWI